MLTLSEAAKLANISASAILKSIKRGRLSAVRDDFRGQWRIDVSELSRVYPLKSAPTPVTDKPIESGEILAERVRALERLVGTLESERNDLRRRLDIEAEERRRLTLMLTHQTEKPHDTTQQPRSSLLEKLFGSRSC